MAKETPNANIETKNIKNKNKQRIVSWKFFISGQRNKNYRKSERLAGGNCALWRVPSCQENGLTVSAPSICAVCLDDLYSFNRLEALYVQAVEQKLLIESEYMPVLWVAAAFTARSYPSHPVHIFGLIVTTRSWELIPDNIFFWSRRVIRYHFKKNPLFFQSIL
jgi:hypothetical protein